MPTDDATCWTMIHAAAAGDTTARDRFAQLYEPLARAYFAARWRHVFLVTSLDDAVQDVFVECFKNHGVLAHVAESPPGEFHAYFHGVLRNIARRHETSRGVSQPIPDDHPANDTSLSRAFDRAWAHTLMREAGRVQSETAARSGERAIRRIELLRLRFQEGLPIRDIAAHSGERAIRRIELLRLRFQEGLPIRDIAAHWNDDPARLHHEYAIARDEFRSALRQVVAFHCPDCSDADLDARCQELLSALK